LSETEEKWEYNGTVHQLFIDFKKAENVLVKEGGRGNRLEKTA